MQATREGEVEKLYVKARRLRELKSDIFEINNNFCILNERQEYVTDLKIY